MSSTLFTGATFAIPIPVLSVDPNTLEETAADPDTLVVTVTRTGAVAQTYIYPASAALTRQGVGLYRLTYTSTGAGAHAVVVTTTLGTATGVDGSTVVVVAP